MEEEKNYKKEKKKVKMGSLAMLLTMALLGQLAIPVGRMDTQQDRLMNKYCKDKTVDDSRKFDERWLMNQQLPDQTKLDGTRVQTFTQKPE